MNWKHWISLLAVVATSTAMAGLKGTAPRSAADRYRTHAERDGIAIGASPLPPSQAPNFLRSAVSHCSVVVEFPFYPKKDKPPRISLENFPLQRGGTKNGVKPLSARAVAATIQDRN